MVRSDELFHDILVALRPSKFLVLQHDAVELEVEEQTDVLLYLLGCPLRQIVVIGRILARMAIHTGAAGRKIDGEVTVFLANAVRIRLGHEIPHHVIQIRGVRYLYSARFGLNFQLFLNILCQVWLDSDRSNSFRETLFSFHIVFAYFCVLPSYNPTNRRYDIAKILKISELSKFYQTYFRPTHSFFRILHVLQSYK